MPYSAAHQPNAVVPLMTVCTGNICRSPYAAVLLRDGLWRVRPGVFDVTSTGTGAMVGQPIDPNAARLLHARGYDTSAEIATHMTPVTLARQALIFVMTKDQHDIVVDEAPGAHRRTWLIAEFAAALAALGQQQPWPQRMAAAGAHTAAERWAALPKMLAPLRRNLRAAGVSYEVADPYRRGPQAFDVMAMELDAATQAIVGWEAQFPA